MVTEILSRFFQAYNQLSFSLTFWFQILAVVLISVVVLAVVGGVTFYLLELEKLKLQVGN